MRIFAVDDDLAVLAQVAALFLLLLLVVFSVSCWSVAPSVSWSGCFKDLTANSKQQLQQQLHLQQDIPPFTSDNSNNSTNTKTNSDKKQL